MAVIKQSRKPTSCVQRPSLVFYPAILLISAAILVGSPALQAQSTITLCLSELDLGGMTCGEGEVGVNRSVGGNPISLRGRIFQCGVGTHAPSEFLVDLKGSAYRFRATVGIDDEVSTRGSVEFHVWLDGEKVATSGVVRGGKPPKELDVDLTDARQMRLVVTDGGDTMDFDHADWGGAVIELLPEAGDTKSVCAICPTAAEPLAEGEPIIAFGGESVAPVLHGPRVTGTTPGRPFLFRIPATGEPPLRYSAEGLPAGLELDISRGILTGSIQTTGTYPVNLTVENVHGRTSRRLTIQAGHRKLALTPPLGWNSWNIWGEKVDDNKIRAAADAMVRTGLADHGYSYICIDDGWEGERTASGVLRPNSKFPDMKGLADYVHSKGLKLGIYSSPGPRTCQGLPGSHGYEEIDANTWANWGIDFLKYDWCSYTEIAGGNPSLGEMKEPYKVMRRALDCTGRDIVYSLCQYGMGEVHVWGAEPEIGGNMWRTTTDITDTWRSLSEIGFGQDAYSSYAGPGHWNDPDMLVIGILGWGANPRPARLTRHEQVTQLTLWSLLAAPLMIGCDLDQLDEFTLSILTNDDVLDVNQDPRGEAARLRFSQGDVQVWSRPLADDSVAVGVFNLSDLPTSASLSLETIGVSGKVAVRDLWLRRDLGEFEQELSFELAPHGSRMLRLRRPVHDQRLHP